MEEKKQKKAKIKLQKIGKGTYKMCFDLNLCDFLICFCCLFTY